jgi:hypothetical protein
MTDIESTPATETEAGVALPLVALMLVTLLGIAAFGIDLGWFFLNASRIQRAADAGALAGVIYMPTDFPQADIVAHQITRTNGYEDGVDSAVVVVSPVINEPVQLQVTITDTVPTFFLKVFGMVDVNITRTARAEFVPPLPMGSPDNQFGNSCDPTQAGCPAQPNFWANIHGRYTNTVNGDAFSSQCKGSVGAPCANLNPTYRDDTSARPGYLYGIEANGNASFTVEFNDVAFHNSSGGLPNGDYVRTGDNLCSSSSSAACGPTMRVALYAPDPTPLDVSDATLLCTQDIAPQPQIAPTAPYSWANPAGCFTVVNPSSGIYVVQVRALGSGPEPIGLNRYSVRSMPATTRLYALGDMSIYNNATGSVTQFYLAEVASIYRGKTFVVELYDAGDAAVAGRLDVIDPTGGVFNSGSCKIYSRTLVTDPWALQSSPGNCQENVHVQEYNGRWLKFEMVLPTSYSCTNCWWKMNYNYPGGVNDTTTWRAYIEGNPIHLVPTS